MKEYLQALNLVDLISEKHKELRKKTRDTWNNNSNLCDNKLHLISMLSIKKMTISESARKMNISRQAIHKFSKSLVEEGLIKVEENSENHKEKLMSLTVNGNELYKELLEIKYELENKIEEKIGKNNLLLLRELLQEPWLL